MQLFNNSNYLDGEGLKTCKYYKIRKPGTLIKNTLTKNTLQQINFGKIHLRQIHFGKVHFGNRNLKAESIQKTYEVLWSTDAL